MLLRVFVAKNKSLNKKLSVTAPKDKTFCGSVQLNARTHFVGIRDSIGKLAAVSCLLRDMGLDHLPVVTREYLLREGNTEAYHKQQRLLPAIKIKRAATIREHLIAKLKKQQKDREKKLLYESNILIKSQDGCEELTTTSKCTYGLSLSPKLPLIDCLYSRDLCANNSTSTKYIIYWLYTPMNIVSYVTPGAIRKILIAKCFFP